MPIQQFFLTQEGLTKLKKEHEELTNKKRPLAVDRLSRAREFGDLTENSEYFAARDDLMFIDDRIAELENILKKVKVIKPKPNCQFVMIGSTVIVEHEEEIREFIITGTLEADPAQGRISDESPVGRALLNAKAGDSVEVNSPLFKAVYKVLEIK